MAQRSPTPDPQETSVFDAAAHQPIPLWRDIRVIQAALQAIFAVVAIAVLFTLVNNIYNALVANGQTPTFGFWENPISINFNEGRGIASTDSNATAFITGLLNTLRAVGVGLVLATILGVLVGIALLTPNWLVRKITEVYVEIFRNTPLLVQLIFFYQGVFRALPQIRDVIELPGPVFLSIRGLVMPAIVPTEVFPTWLLYVVVGIVVAAGVWTRRSTYQRETGNPGYQVRYTLVIVLGFALLGWLAVGNVPWTIELPEQAFRELPTGETVVQRIVGGETISPEYAAMVVGLVLYTAAFIGEIVRAGIQAVSYGQIEAARAQGFSYGQTLQLIILPQALRVIIPPLGNQYLNLAKNSSLAIAIAFQDVFAITRTIMNQSGQSIVPFLTVMLLYLVMSLVISLAMNLVNQSMKLKER